MNSRADLCVNKDKHLNAQHRPNIGLFAASCRKHSINRKLIGSIEKTLQSKGADTTVIDLLDFPMPLFCADMEIPENAHKLAQRLNEFDAIFIATPELNGSPPAILKNLIDWTSVLGTNHFTGPIYAIGAATPGPMSGVMAMQHLSYILARLGATVIPINVGAGNAKTAFDEDQQLIADPAKGLALAMADQLIARVTERTFAN